MWRKSSLFRKNQSHCSSCLAKTLFQTKDTEERKISTLVGDHGTYHEDELTYEDTCDDAYNDDDDWHEPETDYQDLEDSFNVEEYDQCYVSHLEARQRTNALRMRRVIFYIEARQHTNALRTSKGFARSLLWPTHQCSPRPNGVEDERAQVSPRQHDDHRKVEKQEKGSRSKSSKRKGTTGTSSFPPPRPSRSPSILCPRCWKYDHIARDCTFPSAKRPRIGSDDSADGTISVGEADVLTTSGVVDRESWMVELQLFGWEASRWLGTCEQFRWSDSVVFHSHHTRLKFGNDEVSVENSCALVPGCTPDPPARDSWLTSWQKFISPAPYRGLAKNSKQNTSILSENFLVRNPDTKTPTNWAQSVFLNTELTTATSAEATIARET